MRNVLNMKMRYILIGALFIAGCNNPKIELSDNTASNVAAVASYVPTGFRSNAPRQEGCKVTDRSVHPAQFGRFLIAIFDEWVRKDVGDTFVLNFDGALAGWLGMAGTVCIFGPTCGLGMALEHNGDLYSCDHFVESKHLLGNILRTPLIGLVASEKQRRFGQDKKDSLPRTCRACDVIHICNGECPKNRFVETPDGERGLNYLCTGYKAFFTHAEKAMRIMADLLRRNRPASEVMGILASKETDRNTRNVKADEGDYAKEGLS